VVVDEMIWRVTAEAERRPPRDFVLPAVMMFSTTPWLTT
jgi:hypothetical protein